MGFDDGNESYHDVDDACVVYVSQEVLDRYYPPLEPGHKGEGGVLEVDVEDEGVVIYLHPDATWEHVRKLFVDAGDCVEEGYETVVPDDHEAEENKLALAWARLLGDVVRRKDAEGREWEVLADTPSPEASALGRFFRTSFTPWDVACLVSSIRREWPTNDGKPLRVRSNIRNLGDRLVADAFGSEENYQDALTGLSYRRPQGA
jgi:hypothetical protein